MRVLHFLYQAVGIEMYFWNLLKKSFLVGLFSCKNGNLKAQIHTKITNKQIMMQTGLGKKSVQYFHNNRLSIHATSFACIALEFRRKIY